MSLLKLIALDAGDLQVISAQMQDAVLSSDDIDWAARAHRFALIANRFAWDADVDAGAAREPTGERRAAVLRFSHVLRARLQGIDPKAEDTVLSLLAIQFEETEAPGGVITLTFAGDGAIALDVECIEAELVDLAEGRAAVGRPRHAIADDAGATLAPDAEVGDASYDDV
ncbi:MAG: DUF2948 family protein [Pseudomonadota bacterium]